MKTSIKDQTKWQTKWPDLLNRIQKDYSSGPFPRSEIRDLNHLEEWAAATSLLEYPFETLRMFSVFPHLDLHLPPPVSSVPLLQSPFETEITTNSTGQKSGRSSKSGVSHSRKWVCPDWVTMKASYTNSLNRSPHSERSSWYCCTWKSRQHPESRVSPQSSPSGLLAPPCNLSQGKATPFTQLLILESLQWVLISPFLSPTSVCQFCLTIF